MRIRGDCELYASTISGGLVEDIGTVVVVNGTIDLIIVDALIADITSIGGIVRDSIVHLN